MKILGQTNINPRTVEVPVGTDADGKVIKMTVHAVPFDELLRIERELPDPQAPSTGEKKKDERGRYVKRNGQFVMERNEEDENYLREKDLRDVAVRVATVISSLGDQIGDVRGQRPDETRQTYYINLLSEMNKAGIDMGIFTMLAQAAERLSQPMTNLELLRLRTMLGTEKETPEITEDREKELVAAAQEEEAKGNA